MVLPDLYCLSFKRQRERGARNKRDDSGQFFFHIHSLTASQVTVRITHTLWTSGSCGLLTSQQLVYRSELTIHVLVRYMYIRYRYNCNGTLTVYMYMYDRTPYVV